MKVFSLLIIFQLSCFPGWGQNAFRAVIKDSDSKEPLVGASVNVKGTQTGTVSDTQGKIELKNIPDGKSILEFRYVGYKERVDTFQFPMIRNETAEILLIASSDEMDEIIVRATRSSRTISDVPTRIEAISGEELDEKGNMKPGDIRMMLNESTGIQTQQTSATSYNSSIRIQGLDGKYTQILRDGFPLYSGFSGGLSLLQIVPLDLQQVEVIKGASSTLYGGGAIAGLVNLVSKTPGEKDELSFILNGTSALGLDLSGFYSQKFRRTGATVFASYNSGNPYDPAGIGLTAIPEFNRFTLNPRLFLYIDPKTTLSIGFNSTMETRTGGDIKYIEGKGDSIHSYFEDNNTKRFSTQLDLAHQIKESGNLSFKNSISYYDRKIEIPDFIFSGVQLSSFTEASYSIRRPKQEWILGANLWTEKFTQERADTSPVVDYNHITGGLFIQNTFNISDRISLESGIRGDYQNLYGFFFLPRISLLVKVTPKLTVRTGGGMGYKTPTVFTEDAERLQFRNVLPINASTTEAERSSGGNIDLNYHTPLGARMSFSINSLLFYTRISKPLILTDAGNGQYEFIQPGGFIRTRGLETNAKLTFGNFRLFIGYTLADVYQETDGTGKPYPLVAKHRLNNVLTYEINEKLKMGLEAYYYSPQYLNDGKTGKAYWLCGLMAERIWKHISLFINFENLLDTRQTKFDTIYTGTVTNPVFRDIYAPLDGFVVNGGVKIFIH
jgi:outer membrane receptor for ferrienterochelin and colicins